MTFEYAKRIKRLPPYLFAEIEKKIKEKKAQGIDLISLSIGDPDFHRQNSLLKRSKRRQLTPRTTTTLSAKASQISVKQSQNGTRKDSMLIWHKTKW